MPAIPCWGLKPFLFLCFELEWTVPFSLCCTPAPVYSTRKLTQLCSDHDTNTFWNFGVCAQHLLPSSLRHSPCLIHHFSISSRSADPLTSVSQGWFRPSDRDVRRHCRGFWERECSSLDLGCADMRPGAAWGILRPQGWWTCPGSRCEGWREMGPKDIFPLSWTWSRATPGLPVLQAFLLFLWLQAWVGFSAVKTLSDHIYSILRFLKQQRNFALSEAEFSLQAVHPVTGPRTWEAGPEGLGMSCFRNRRPGGMKVALRCSDIMGDRKAICSSWFQIVSELEPTCAMWTKTTFSQLERKKDCFTLWAAQQWKQLMPCST